VTINIASCRRMAWWSLLFLFSNRKHIQSGGAGPVGSESDS